MPANSSPTTFKTSPWRTLTPVHKVWVKNDKETVDLGGLGEWTRKENVNFSDPKSFVERKKKDGTNVYYDWYSSYNGHLLKCFVVTPKTINGKEQNHVSLVFKDAVDQCFWLIDLGQSDGGRALSAMSSLIAPYDEKFDMCVKFRATRLTNKKDAENTVALYPVFWQDLAGKEVKYESRYQDKEGVVIGEHLAKMPAREENVNPLTGEVTYDPKNQISWVMKQFAAKFQMVKWDDLPDYLRSLDPEFYDNAITVQKERYASSKNTDAGSPLPENDKVVVGHTHVPGTDRYTFGNSKNPAIGTPPPTQEPAEDLPF